MRRDDAREQREGAGCGADLGVQSGEPQRSFEFVACRQVEFRRVVGEGRRVPVDQLGVARGGTLAPLRGLLGTANVQQDASKLRCVVRIIRAVGQSS